MRIFLNSRRFLAIPAFGLFSLIVVFFFSLAFLSFSHPEVWKDLSPTEAGELSGPQGVLLLSLSAGMAAALSGMLSWGLLITLPWQWLRTRSWRMMALFGGLIGLIEIIWTSWLMWIIYLFLFSLIIRPSFSDIMQLLPLIPLGIPGMVIFTVVVVSFGSKGSVFLIAIGAGMFSALLARLILSQDSQA